MRYERGMRGGKEVILLSYKLLLHLSSSDSHTSHTLIMPFPPLETIL